MMEDTLCHPIHQNQFSKDAFDVLITSTLTSNSDEFASHSTTWGSCTSENDSNIGYIYMKVQSPVGTIKFNNQLIKEQILNPGCAQILFNKMY